MHLSPGEQTPVHGHQWPAVLYVISWGDFVRYDPEGRVLVDSRALGMAPSAGASLWSGPLPPHFVRNVGQAELRIIAVELKQP